MRCGNLPGNGKFMGIGLEIRRKDFDRSPLRFSSLLQMNLQTMLSMRHVAPFREEAQNELQVLSDTSDTLERW